MRPLDWLVLIGTVVAIVAWGVWKERGARTSEAFLRGGSDLRWWTIGLSIMATQASAITFLSMPGQAYEDGLGFVQFYLGLPVAMVLLSAFVVPIYYKLRVYTAYEYLETRFDRKTRQLTALLFLISRGLAAGVSIYAPAIVLQAVLGWPLRLTTLLIGGITILYTVTGGARTVGRTQTYQMVVMLGGVIAAAGLIWHLLPLSLEQTLHVAGALGRLDAVDFRPRWDTRYTFWSGITGGLFVQLAYFGTDQSQVQRYLGGASLAESRLGLLLNGVIKIPMQFLILSVGVLLFVFYLLSTPPVFFDRAEWAQARSGAQAAQVQRVDEDWARTTATRRVRTEALADAVARHDDDARKRARNALRDADGDVRAVRKRAQAIVAARHPGHEVKDADYIFIDFVVTHFPAGLLGLLMAVILCASMSATAAALSSLGATSVVDFYRLWRPGLDEARSLAAGRMFTILWGAVAVAFALFAAQLDNLIQAVNILGSLFYGPMLGVFLVGFFLPRVRATPAFVGVLVGEAIVIAVWLGSSIGFLWYNVIGCAAVVATSLLLTALDRDSVR